MFLNSKSTLFKDDLPVILRGLFLLFAIIIVGVGATWHQLANLTQKNDTAFFPPTSFLPYLSYFETDNNYLYFKRLPNKEFFSLYQFDEVVQKDGGLIFKLTGYEFGASYLDLSLMQAKEFLNPALLIEEFRKIAYKFRDYTRSCLGIIKETVQEKP